MRPILSELAERHLEAAGNDREKALETALAEVRRDRSLRDRVLQEALHKAIYFYIGKDLQQQRRRAIDGAIRIAAAVTVDAVGKAREVCATLMDFPMRSGQVLAMSKRSEVLETADWYLRSGRIQLHRGYWLKAVAERLPNAYVLVGSALSREELQALYTASSQQEAIP